MIRFLQKFALLVGLSLFFSSSPLSAISYYADSPEVVELDSWYRSYGMLFSVSSYPVPGTVLLEKAQRLQEKAKGNDSRTTAAIIERLAEAEKPPRIRVLTGANLQYRFFANPQRAENGDPHSTASAIDFQRFFLSKPSLAVLDLSAQSEQGFFLSVRGDFMSQWKGDLFETENIPILGEAGSESSFENHFVTRGNLTWSNGFIIASFGRDTMRLGPRRGSSLYPSDKIPYMDSARLTVPFGSLTMDWFISSLHPYAASGHDVDPNLTSTGGTVADGSFGFEGDETPSDIWHTAHRFELNLGRVSAAIGGQVLIARRNNHLQLTDFIPAIAWHNGDIRPNNMSIVLQLRALPLPGLELSIDAGYDDINANAVGIGDYSIPTIDAYIGRAVYDLPVPWGRLSFFAEAGTTHYLWGNFDAAATGIESQYVNTLARAIYRYRIDGNWGAALLPLTSPFGPGVQWMTLETGATVGKLKLRLNYQLLSINTLANLIDTPYREDATVANGPRVMYHDVGLSASYDLNPITVTMSPSLVIRDGAVGFECSFILSARYAARFL